jgi:prepilin-type N-terminal cleavage/methylation domain-containing protein
MKPANNRAQHSQFRSPTIWRKSQVQAALTLTEVLVVLAVIGMLAMLILPLLAKRMAKSSRPNCQNNLKQIGLAFRTWEGDHGDRYPMSVPTAEGGSMEALAGTNLFRHFQVMGDQLNNPKILICPADDRGSASNFTTLQNSNLSYFIGLDADETQPAGILSGDRNLITNGVPVVAGLVLVRSSDALNWSAKMHNWAGNIGLADGSVQSTTKAEVQKLFQNAGTNVTRLAVP